MVPRTKSRNWYIRNVSSGNVVYLNIGEFRIGRHEENDLNVIYRSCSKYHFTITLRDDQDDSVHLINKSRWGTYVNGVEATDIDLLDGDQISIINQAKVMAHQRPNTNYLVYQLHRENVEVLVTTDTIVIPSDDDDDDDENNNVEMKNISSGVKKLEFPCSANKIKNDFDEDYEIGEPSSKHFDPPVPSPPSPKRSLSPISKHLARKNAENLERKVRKAAKEWAESMVQMQQESIQKKLEAGNGDAKDRKAAKKPRVDRKQTSDRNKFPAKNGNHDHDHKRIHHASDRKKLPAKHGDHAKDRKTPEKSVVSQAMPAKRSNIKDTSTGPLQKKQRIAHVPKVVRFVIPKKNKSAEVEAEAAPQPKPKPKPEEKKRRFSSPLSCPIPEKKAAPAPAPQPQPKPKPEAKKRRSISPLSCPIPKKQAIDYLDALLTPPDVVVLPENEVEILPFDKIMWTIVNWDPKNLLDSKYNKLPFQKLIARMPQRSFRNYDNYEKVLTSVAKCHLWHHLNANLQRNSMEADFSLDAINPCSLGNYSRLVYKCKTRHDLVMKVGEAVVVKATVNIAMEEKEFLGYVTDIIKKDGTFFFDLQVSTTHMNKPIKAVIIAQHHISHIVEQFKCIINARDSILFEGILDPSKLPGFTKNKPICALGNIQKYNNPLSPKQSQVFQPLYNSTVEALVRGTGFFTPVSGYPGTGKSRILLEMIVCLVSSDALKKKNFKILVTGHNYDVVDSLANKLCEIRRNISAAKHRELAFVRYGARSKYSSVRDCTAYHYSKIDPTKTMDQHIQSARIVFAPVDKLIALKTICNKYDVILYDNASESSELISIIPLCLSPSAYILFGDPDRKPNDSLHLDQKYEDYNLNQSMFKRMTSIEYGKTANNNVLRLNDQKRFSTPVHNFLNKCLYKSQLDPPGLFNAESGASDRIAGFRMFHREKDGLMFDLLQRMMEISPPSISNTYGVIVPPNVNPIDVQYIISPNYRYHVIVSSNMNFTIDDRSIVIIWIDESITSVERFLVENLKPALTRARKAIYFIGNIEFLRNDPQWVTIFRYADSIGAYYNLDGVMKIYPSIFFRRNE